MEVYLEVGPKRTFACALDWPGWCRSGKTDTDALAALVGYGPRYAAAIGPDWGFAPHLTADDLEIVERLRGGRGTDFGAPSVPAAADVRPVDPAELARLSGILRAAWAAFDAAAASAPGQELRKGPRGGGRALDKIVAHVAEAEDAYLWRLGGSARDAVRSDVHGQDRALAVREVAIRTMADRVQGVPLPENPRRTAALWSVRYYARRSAWHALDHAWEIEDRR